MKKSAIKLALLGLTIGFCAAQFSVSAETVSSFTKETDGALCQLSGGTKLKLQVCADNIIRVVYTSQSSIPAPQGLVVGKASFSPGTFDATDNGTAIVVTTPKVTATVSKTTALITFSGSTGGAVCTETGRTLSPVTKGSQAGFSGTLNFNSPSSEKVYGLGQLSMGAPGWGSGGGSWWEANPPDRTGQLNIRSFAVDMHQANWYDVIPFFLTTSGYGVLMNFGCHATKASPLNFTADFLLNNSWDYFFIYGPQFDNIISGYRDITGPVPMLPKWAYGFWQCKNRYMSSSQILGVIDTFRSNNIPLDCIVQDWSWWTGTTSGYGSFTWDSPYTNPAPATWISTLHGKNAHFAISIWENFMPGESNYSAMQSHLISTTCNSNAGPYLNIFDTTGARLYWNLMNSVLFSNGVDAWWNDATEPECPELTGFSTSNGVIDQYNNEYSLACAKNIYTNQRAASSAKRVCNLSRSFYGGQARFGTIYWNGDLSSSSMLNVGTTVSGGLNSSMAGNPYWCSDIGGFQVNGGSLTDDILTRWFQAGTFFPIFRIHGSRATEIYNMSSTARPIATAFNILRYRLMPYIYSLAWKVTNENYTITRALPFDFSSDPNVLSNDYPDQYMFGTALLVNPVHAANASSRSVYLPAGTTWYNFWTGETTAGGATVNASAPAQIIPIYGRAGAILPMGPKIQYAAQSNDPIELRVYPGANGSFTLYEDEGDNYNYEKGTYATIPITYIDKPQNLIIGARSGTFPGMLANRTFKVVFVKTGHGIADTITADPDFTLTYSGSPVATGVVEISKPNSEVSVFHPVSVTLKTTGNSVVLGNAFVGKSKSVGVYDLGGKLIAMKTLKANEINLRKDLGVPSGIYIVKVKTLP
jgi:alpha-D-xyloside xylohydrolase